MVHGVREPDALEALLQRSTLIALGPGLGQSDWALGLFERALAAGRPLVLDADALNLLAQAPRRRDDWIMTPHPGEAARMLDTSAAEVEADRFAAVRRLQERYGGVVVLKGAGTLITGPGLRPIGLCPQGNPGMASAGMGDALTGIIAGLLAQGLEPALAAEVGVCLHGAAGDRAGESGQRGLLASDLIGVLQALLAEADGER
jgi:NAD(P)H-hydrate epimerase